MNLWRKYQVPLGFGAIAVACVFLGARRSDEGSTPQPDVPHPLEAVASERTDRSTDEQARTMAHALLKDPELFRKYCERLPAGEWAQEFWRSAIRELSPRNPEQAIELAKQLDSDDDRTELLRSIASDWVQRDPAPAFSWLLGEKNDFLSDEQICAAVKIYAATDPVRAMECLVSLVRSDQLMNDTLLAVFGGWVGKQPADAARAVELLDDDETRKGAVAVVARTWMRTDPMTAYIWMKGLPEIDSLIAEQSSN